MANVRIPTFLLLLGCTAAGSLDVASWGAHTIALEATPETVRLTAEPQTWRFTARSNRWALEAIEVGGKPLVAPQARQDSLWLGSGEADKFETVTDTPETKSIRLTVGANAVTYTVNAGDRLPLVHVALDGPATAACAFRTITAHTNEHGAWVTRGWVATDADASENFIDGSNPWVFGHSTVGKLDLAYAWLPKVNPHIQPNGRTEQRADTWFSTRRSETEDGRFAAAWQLRMGPGEPKEFAVLFDRNPGARLSDVCEKYFAEAVDTMVDLTQVPQAFDPEKCLQVMPVRLAAPDAFIPGYGWMMDEWPKASYPYAHDSVWQTGAFLAYEGLATERDWERFFGGYVLDHTPLGGPERKAYFVRRPGGLVRWGYFSSYQDPFPPLEGGVWWTADVIHQGAVALGDEKLRQAAIDMMRHDVDVKLDLERMEFPPCWDPIRNRAGEDHRDDWFQTPGLAWCAYAAATILFPATQEAGYLTKADRITDWFAEFMVPERKLNFLQGKNLHAVFSGYVPLAFLERFGRTGDRRFLELARDMAWIHIMTTCTTPARGPSGEWLTGTTCVGVRDCVDYDCAPNLCHEKDLTFVQLIGPLLDQASGPAYAKYLQLHRLTLRKDAWNSAWTMEQRDTNLRTVYDNYARGMANLIYALDQSSAPQVLAVNQGVSKADPEINTRRDIVLANATAQHRTTKLKVRFLKPGRYEVDLEGEPRQERRHDQLATGLEVAIDANTTRRLGIRSLELTRQRETKRRYSATTNWLSDLQPFAAQRGTGFPEPTYRRDRSLDDHPLRLGAREFAKGLGCGANTVLVYDLDHRHERFEALVGVDAEVAGATNPPPSVCFTVHVDGRLRFESGPMYQDTPPRTVKVDLRNARTLMLRVSNNWDDDGRSANDRGDWADARLIGKSD